MKMLFNLLVGIKWHKMKLCKDLPSHGCHCSVSRRNTTIQSRTKMQNACPIIHRYLAQQLLNLKLFSIIHTPITSRHLTELWQYCLEGLGLTIQFNIISIQIVSNKFEKICVLAWYLTQELWNLMRCFGRMPNSHDFAILMKTSRLRLLKSHKILIWDSG